MLFTSGYASIQYHYQKGIVKVVEEKASQNGWL